MFRLTKREKMEVVTICDHLHTMKFSPVNPRAFTEHGAIMAASVLNSSKAVEVSVFIVRAFVKLRTALAEHTELARRIAKLQHHLTDHDDQILSLVQAIRQFPTDAGPTDADPAFSFRTFRLPSPPDRPRGPRHGPRRRPRTHPSDLAPRLRAVIEEHGLLGAYIHVADLSEDQGASIG